MRTASRLKAIGSCIAQGVYFVKFYYEEPDGGRDLSMPAWEVPARTWDHMQAVVRAFNAQAEANP